MSGEKSLEQSKICVVCDEVIALDAQYVEFEDLVYHVKHFKCAGSCGLSLVGKPFGRYENELYCETDFSIVTSETCDYCKSLILDDAIFALDKYYHKDHFLYSYF